MAGLRRSGAASSEQEGRQTNIAHHEMPEMPISKLRRGRAASQVLRVKLRDDSSCATAPARARRRRHVCFGEVEVLNVEKFEPEAFGPSSWKSGSVVSCTCCEQFFQRRRCKELGASKAIHCIGKIHWLCSACLLKQLHAARLSPRLSLQELMDVQSDMTQEEDVKQEEVPEPESEPALGLELKTPRHTGQDLGSSGLSAALAHAAAARKSAAAVARVLKSISGRRYHMRVAPQHLHEDQRLIPGSEQQCFGQLRESIMGRP
eukprot:TRINITY_DN32839_c0_g1_i1.p1 TRINITY_DN32839_c0_g1~~TRINITY_DN32839_c0_g1_i1.p1  ORF type:complete len:262 (-),score=51.21 TRINITY_DN32839_c0_g1_i1:28-813(-)